MSANKELSPTACIRVGKGTPSTDSVPTAIPSGIYSKPLNGREQALYPPPCGHIQPCTHCVDYDSKGDTTNGWKNAQTLPDFSRKEVPNPLWGTILLLVTDAAGDGSYVGLSPPFGSFPPSCPCLSPLRGGVKSDLQKTGTSYGKHTAADHKCQQGRGSGQLSALPAVSRLPGSQQHFQPPCHRDIRSALSQAAGAGGRWAGT